MALDDKDIQALQLLIREEIRSEVTPFREEVRSKFDDMQSNFDALFARDEKREHEYLAVRGQIARLEERVDTLEKEGAA